MNEIKTPWLKSNCSKQKDPLFNLMSQPDLLSQLLHHKHKVTNEKATANLNEFCKNDNYNNKKTLIRWTLSCF